MAKDTQGGIRDVENNAQASKPEYGESVEQRQPLRTTNWEMVINNFNKEIQKIFAEIDTKQGPFFVVSASFSQNGKNYFFY